MKIVIARRIFRIGVQKLWYDPDTHQYWVSIQNRTYHSMWEISPERAERWKQALTSSRSSGDDIASSTGDA